MKITAVVECPVYDSFRVRQVAGMFDVPLRERCAERFDIEVPGPEESWDVGVIVGPSGSGKTTVARHAFGDHLYAGGDWPADRAVVDCFGDEVPIQQVAQALTAVGFSSPPAWVKPYAVLSNGEKFRCDLARALMAAPARRHEGTKARGETPEGQELSGPSSSPSGLRASVPACLPLVAFDEFTSVVDRTVARVASAAVSRAIRGGRIRRRFVAVTCHYDVVQWLEPDWVVDMAQQSLARGRLRRPPIRLIVRRADASLWRLFKRHHYLSTHLHRSATCYVGAIDGSPAVFTAVLAFPHPTRPGWKEHRTVCLPDFQGVGIGNAMSEFVASLYCATGRPYFSTTSHPAMIRHRCRSPLWRVTRRPQVITVPHACAGLAASGSAGRLTAGFEYLGPARVEDAVRFGLMTRSGYR